MFLFWERTLFPLLCYGRPPIPKVPTRCRAHHMPIFEIFILKKLGVHPAREGGGDCLLFLIPDVFLHMFSVAPHFNPLFFSLCFMKGVPRGTLTKVCFNFGGRKHFYAFMLACPFFRKHCSSFHLTVPSSFFK
jgi:hypothetical protein